MSVDWDYLLLIVSKEGYPRLQCKVYKPGCQCLRARWENGAGGSVEALWCFSVEYADFIHFLVLNPLL